MVITGLLIGNSILNLVGNGFHAVSYGNRGDFQLGLGLGFAFCNINQGKRTLEGN